MDIELGGPPNGIDAALEIKEQHPDIGIVILSSHRERKYTSQVLLGETSGWSYLLKQSVKEIDTLARAIHGAASGLVVMDPAVINSVKPRKDSAIGALTPREQEVLDVMSQGYSNGAIADKLVLNVKSVENYINAIYQELSIEHGPGCFDWFSLDVSQFGSAPTPSTGIFCRPNCPPGRRTRPDHRVHFANPASTYTAGYRPCLVCKPLEGPPGPWQPKPAR